MKIQSPQELGLLVRSERKAQNLSQEALAERIDATRQWVRMLEQGKPRLELGLTLRALTALGLIVDIHGSRTIQKAPAVQDPVYILLSSGKKKSRTTLQVGSSRGINLDSIINRARTPKK